MKKALVLIFLIVSLFACAPQPAQSTATDSPATVTEIPQTSLPATASLTPSPPPTLAQPTAISIPALDQIVHYYFVNPAEITFPAGSIVVMPETYILAPTLSDTPFGPDPSANLRSALEAALHDSRNGWLSSDLEIVSATLGDGHADAVLQGEYFGVGDVTMIAASMQILLTVFANADVQTATVTLNGDTVGNLGVSNSMHAKPADYVFTRTEIETYMIEHAYASP